MKNNAVVVFAGFLLLFAFSGFLIYRDGLSRQPVPSTQISTSVESIKNLGQLLVMKAALKEIVTAERPYNKIPAQPLLTPKKIAIIFKFDANFSYNLRDRDSLSRASGTKPSSIFPKSKSKRRSKIFTFTTSRREHPERCGPPCTTSRKKRRTS